MNWVQNVRAAGGRAVLKSSRREEVHLEEIPAEQRAPILKAYLQRAPGARPHVPVDKGAPLAEFEQVAMKRTSLDQEAGDERRRPWSALLRQLGATRPGVWVIKHVVSPLDRWLYQRTGGWRVALGRPLGPLLRLPTTGRRTGKEHTPPVYYVRNGTRLVLRNVNPSFEHPNPWILNLRANPLAIVQIGSEKSIYQAREASQAEVDHYWPQLVQVWPAYQAFYERSRQRRSPETWWII